MTSIAKRICSVLLALALCFGLVPLVPQTVDAATVDYTYQGSYVYNWGQREEACTFLSPMAEAFYEDNGVTYDELASLSGSASTSSVPSSALYKELQSLMSSNHSYKNSYDAVKTLCDNTDCQNGGGSISSFYSGNSIGPSWDGSWNREHTWPNSKGLGGQDENDIMMLRPTSYSENGSRGNTAYGESSGYYDPNDESGGTHNLHGDVARIWLYVYVRWGNTQYAWGTSGVMESKEVLLKWMEEDPVDTWEMGRNDSVESITGTRNVFVDYPELAFLMFNEDVPASYQTPSGEGNAMAYTVTALSNNTGYGTVSCTGRTITATPNTGYYVQGYTVTSGTATVTQNGNTFNVQASSDCTVRINFAARTAASVIYMEGGLVANSTSCYQGDTVTIADHSGALPEDYSFIGWVKTKLDETTVKPATIYTVGASYTVSDTADYFYALYGRVEGSGAGNTDEFTLFSGSIEPGIYVIVYDGYAMEAAVNNQRLVIEAVTVTNDKITSPDASLIWQLEETSDGYYTIYNESTGTYAGGIGEKNRAGLLTEVTDYAKWTPSGTSTYEFVNLGQKNNSLNANLRRNGTTGWGCYSTSTGGALTLYQGITGTMYYTTNAVSCEHEDTCDAAQRDATCTTDGYTAGVYCNDCERFISGGETLPATGHSWGDWADDVAATCTTDGTQLRTCAACGEQETQTVAAAGHSYSAVVTPPTATEQGYTTHTCNRCGDSYMDSFVDAVGESVRISFSVPSDVTAVADMYCNKTGITLPSAEAPASYTFVGWTTAAVDDQTAQPVTYAAGEVFTTEAATTLYALYSYVVGGTGSTEYVLTDISQISRTDSVVVTMQLEDTVYALPNNGGSSSPAATTVTAADGKLTAEPASTLLWNIETTDSGYIFYVAGGTDTLYCTSSNTGVKIGTSTANVFIIDEASGYLKNVGVSRYLGVYTGKPDWRCYTSSTTNIGGQVLGFYVKGQAGTTYYTTLQEEPSFAVYTGAAESATYTSLEEALAAYDAATQHIKLLRDAEADVILEADLYLDMNGYSLTGILETAGYKVYGLDSSTDEYGCENMGYFNCVDMEDNAVVPEAMLQTSVTGAARRYLTIQTEEGYTFHRFYLGLTHTTLKPANKGIGYKALFAGDEMVADCIDSFGYTLLLEGNDAVTCSKDGAEFVSGQQLTLRVDSYDAEKYGETGLTAGVYMVINGETVTGSSYTTTLRSLVEKLNGMTLTETQKAALAAWIAESETMQTWDVSNIIA